MEMEKPIACRNTCLYRFLLMRSLCAFLLLSRTSSSAEPSHFFSSSFFLSSFVFPFLFGFSRKPPCCLSHQPHFSAPSPLPISRLRKKRKKQRNSPLLRSLRRVVYTCIYIFFILENTKLFFLSRINKQP